MKEELKQMEEVISLGKLGHAYLFYGKNNEELFDFALSFSALLLGEKNNKGVRKNLEFYLIDPEDKSEIKVEQIRKLIGYLALSAPNNGFKVALIKDADRMNKNASNSLLKVLEEPSKNKILILTSSNSGVLLPTILSRVQKIMVLTKQQKNVINNSKLISQLHQLLNSDITEKFNIIDKISKSENIIVILDTWLSFFSDLIYLKSDCKNLIKNNSYIEYLDEISKKYSKEDIKIILKEILNTKDILRNTNANIRLTLENLVLNF
jgi:DNA polymerase III gamma/tau subunit